MPTKDMADQIRKFTTASPGTIIIFHDGTTLVRPDTKVVEVLPQVLEVLLKKGYRLSTVSGLLQI